jgi:hypothetical protein
MSDGRGLQGTGHAPLSGLNQLPGDLNLAVPNILDMRPTQEVIARSAFAGDSSEGSALCVWLYADRCPN